METIRNYLESMFAKLPASPEVKKAKEELLAMMEDKYSELLADGKPENEAVAEVIANFGNLSEIAETLNIADVIEEHPNDEKTYRQVTMEESKQFVEDYNRKSNFIGLGVMLLIFAPGFACFFDTFAMLPDGFSGMGFLLSIAAGVGLIIYGANQDRRWKALSKKSCMIDYRTAEHLTEKLKENENSIMLMRIIGIICCVCALIPVTIFNSLEDMVHVTAGIDIGEMGAFGMFLLIGIGVCLLIASAGRKKAYRFLLGLNPDGTMAKTYVVESLNEEEYKNDGIKTVMSCYWHTVTCLYLCLSFLTFAWGITWIIWPAAVAIYLLIKFLGKKEVA